MGTALALNSTIPGRALEGPVPINILSWRFRSGSCLVSTAMVSTRGCVHVHRSTDLRSGSALADYAARAGKTSKVDLRTEEKHSVNHYRTLVGRLAADGHLLEMADVVGRLVDAGIDRRYLMPAFESKDVQSAIAVALSRGDMNVFLAFAGQLRLAGFSPLRFVGANALATISQGCQKMLMQDELNELIQVLSCLSECGFAAKRFLDVRDVIKTCARLHNVDAALRYAGLLPPVNLHYNFIMHQFAQRGEMAAVFSAFTTMTRAGIKPDMYSYRSLIDACAHEGEIARANAVFQHIVSSGGVPNVYVYNSFMNVRAEDTDIVWRLYRNMQELGVQPVLATYNIMLKSCSLSKSFDKAISLYEDMRRIRLNLDLFTYSTTIHILGEAKLWEAALDVKEDMIASGLTPNVITWTALIGVCANVGMVDQAFSLFDEMWNAGCAPNEQTYNMLIKACCKGSQYERAFQLFREWKETGEISSYRQSDRRQSFSDTSASPTRIRTQPGMPPNTPCSTPDLVTYNTLMTSCDGEPTLVQEVMEEIVSAGLTPDLTSWSTYIDAHGSKGNLEEAISALCKVIGVPYNRTGMLNLKQALVEKLFNAMREEGVKPDLVVYTSIIKACVEARDADQAFKYFRELKKVGLQPNKVTYHTLFRAQRTCRRLSDVKRALALYEEMREAGYAPNDGILRTLLAQWAEGAIGNGHTGESPAAVPLQFQHEVSLEYSKMLLQKAAVHAQEPAAEPNLMIDLHGLSRGEARAAVLAVLRIIKERYKQGYHVNDDLIIITGVGKRSETPGLAVVRQTVLHVLEKELNLPVKFGPGNIVLNRKSALQGDRQGQDHQDHNLKTEQQHFAVDETHCSKERQSPHQAFLNLSASMSDKSPNVGRGDPSTEIFVRRPTNFGRLIVEKDALREWLSKKRSTIP